MKHLATRKKFCLWPWNINEDAKELWLIARCKTTSPTVYYVCWPVLPLWIRKRNPKCDQMYPKCDQIYPKCDQIYPKCDQIYPKCVQIYPKCDQIHP